MICAWIETSSAETGFVAHDELRLERQRARDPDALTLTARELVRVAMHVLGKEPDACEQLRHAVLELGALRAAVHDERFANDRLHVEARVQAGVRILEDDLHALPKRAQLFPLHAEHVPALERDRAEVAGISRRIVRPAVVLPQPLSPDEPERAARRDVEADAVHRLDPRRSLAEDAAPHREVGAQIAHREERRAHRWIQPSSTPWQATVWAVRQLEELRLLGRAALPRERAAIPEAASRGKSTADGTMPGITSRRSFFPSTSGRLWKSPFVYGWSGSSKSATTARTRRLSRRT
jgi:hypothetical protein